MINKLKKSDVKLLAEKVESEKGFKEARENDYSYVQGFYFYRPKIISGRTLPSHQIQQLELLKEINNREPDFNRIEQIVKSDTSMSYSILRIINSAYYGLGQRVNSIRQAIVLLGIKEFKKWLNLHMMRGLAIKKPEVLIENALIRARFAEEIAYLLGQQNRKLDFFTMGLFSLIGSILERPLSKVIEDLDLPQDIINALLSKEGKIGQVLNLIIYYEKGEWNFIEHFSEKLNLDLEKVVEVYYDALKTAHTINCVTEK